MAVGLGVTNVGRLPIRYLQIVLVLVSFIPLVTGAGLAILTGLFFINLIDDVASLVRPAGAFPVHALTFVASTRCTLINGSLRLKVLFGAGSLR